MGRPYTATLRKECQRSDARTRVMDRENRMLASEICSQLDGKLLFVAQSCDKRDGALFLRTLSMKITQNTVDEIAVLRERFSNRQSCRSKEGPALALRQRNEDLNELQAAGSEP